MWTKPSVLYFLSLEKYCYYLIFIILISGIFWVTNLKYTNAGRLKTVKYHEDMVLVLISRGCGGGGGDHNGLYGEALPGWSTFVRLHTLFEIL